MRSKTQLSTPKRRSATRSGAARRMITFAAHDDDCATDDARAGGMRGLALAAFLAASAVPAAPPTTVQPSYADRPDVRIFIDEMVADYAFDARALRRFFAKVRYQQTVVNAMSRPVLAPPKWYEYAPQFLSSRRIDGGVAFWRANEATLERAQNEFGVPAEVVVAIIGVETFYGRNTGPYRVADALTTLAFDLSAARRVFPQ